MRDIRTTKDNSLVTSYYTVKKIDTGINKWGSTQYNNATSTLLHTTKDEHTHIRAKNDFY